MTNSNTKNPPGWERMAETYLIQGIVTSTETQSKKSHEVEKTLKQNKDPDSTKVQTDIWFKKQVKTRTNEKDQLDENDVAQREVYAQELFRVFLPHYPKTRLSLDANGKMFVVSKGVKGYKCFSDITKTELANHLESGQYTGLGSILPLVLLANERDFKLGNMGVDTNNRIIKIDGDWCFASKRDNTRNFDITDAIIDNLPSPGTYQAYNWLDFYQGGKLNQKPVLTKNMDMDKLHEEINESLLKILLMPESLLTELATHHMQSHLVDDCVDIILERKTQIENALLTNESFLNFLKSEKAEKIKKEFIDDLSAFKMTGKAKLVTDEQSINEINTKFTNLENILKQQRLLITALRNNDDVQVMTLINEGVDLNKAIDNQGNTSLHYAIEKNHFKIVQLLLTSDKLDVNNINKKGTSALELAVEKGNLEVVKLLTAHENIDINQANPNYDSTAMHIASRHGHLEIVNHLISKDDIKLNEIDNKDNTPLHYAVIEEHPDIISALVKAGAKTDIINNDGYTPLFHAVANEQVAMIDALLKADVKPDELSSGFSPLEKAIEIQNPKIFMMLLNARIKSGKPVDLDNNDDKRLLQSALKLAIELDKVKFFNELCELGVNVDFPNEDGDTPLYHAASEGASKITKALLDMGANPNSKNIQTPFLPLYVAASTNQTDILKMLLYHKDTDINIQNEDYDNRTQLHLAVENNDKKAVQMLIKHGAKLDKVDNLGDTPLDYAIHSKNFSISVLLLSKQIQIMNLPTIEFDHLDSLLSRARDIDQIKNVNNFVKLYQAIADNKPETFKKLLEDAKDNGKPFDPNDSDNQNIIRAAINRGNPDFIIELCDAGLTDAALLIAAELNKPDLIDFLIENGANPDCVNQYGETPLHILILSEQGDNTDTIKSILKRMTNPDQTDKSGSTPLQVATKNGKDNTLLTLLRDKRIDINAQKKPNFSTALHLAAQNAHGIDSDANEHIIKILLANGARLDLQNSDGNTSLHLAATNLGISNELMKTILEYDDSDLDIPNKKGETVLMMAAKSRNKHAVEAILESEKYNTLELLNKQNSLDYNRTAILYAVKNSLAPGLVEKMVLLGADTTEIRENTNEYDLHDFYPSFDVHTRLREVIKKSAESDQNSLPSSNEAINDDTLIESIKNVMEKFCNDHPKLTGVAELNKINNKTNINEKVYLKVIAEAFDECVQHLTQGQNINMFDSRAKILSTSSKPSVNKSELELLDHALIHYADYKNKPHVLYEDLYSDIQNLEQALIAEQKREALVQLDSLAKYTTSDELRNLYNDCNQYIQNSDPTESLKELIHYLRQPEMSGYHEMVNEKNIDTLTKNIINKTPNPKEIVKNHLPTQDKQEIKGTTYNKK